MPSGMFYNPWLTLLTCKFELQLCGLGWVVSAPSELAKDLQWQICRLVQWTTISGVKASDHARLRRLLASSKFVDQVSPSVKLPYNVVSLNYTKTRSRMDYVLLDLIKGCSAFYLICSILYACHFLRSACQWKLSVNNSQCVDPLTTTEILTAGKDQCCLRYLV